MPSIPQPGEVTICEINRDLITADELSDDAAKETYGKVLGIIFSPVPFQSENLLSTLSSEQGADQRKSGLLWAALQAVSTSLLRHCFHPIDVKLLQDVDFHVLDWHQHKHILAFISGQHQVRIRDYEDSEGGSPCVLINDSQKDVRSLSWRPNGGRALAVACKGGICIWAASFLGNTASVRSGVTLDAHLIPVELSDIQSLTGSRGIDKIAWDSSGERLALSYRDGNDLYRGLIAIYDVRRSPLISASLVGFIRGPGNDTKPITFSFHDKFKQGPLLSVCWSSGYCCTYPLIFRSNVLP
uniref:Anaphase-promoting complex subunit 4 WD40 domain-containing protein n=1 Tax=Solanum lycopersicum TaxID=4081 RepID=A0A3Q7IHF2_SOLLC